MPHWSMRCRPAYNPGMADPSQPEPPSDPPSYESLARRYLDLWQDQWTAGAADPEMADMMARLFQMMGQGMAAAPFPFGPAGFGSGGFGFGGTPGTGWDPRPSPFPPHPLPPKRTAFR